MIGMRCVVLLSLFCASATARCPVTGGHSGHWSKPPPLLQKAPVPLPGVRHNYRPLSTPIPPLTPSTYKAIQKDIEKLLVTSQDFWPADFGHYGGLFIRLAWHCSGTYRKSDGRGGCDGGRIRHYPEFNWEDNTNLDKALELLEPLHHKWEDKISWGDLIVLTGNVAITSMGGPSLGFCGGRVDDIDGTDSLPLGPTAIQEGLAPCPKKGECKLPLGQSQIELIYVNPGGPAWAPSDPKESAKDIRDVFSRMGFDDREQVALIGGGHAFGKVHGACPDGGGRTATQAPSIPHAGTCKVSSHPIGIGNNTWTSGFEGPWTTRPTEWTNLYFQNLLRFDWRLEKGAGGKEQWHPFIKGSDKRGPEVMMLTSDIAFLHDPVYLELVKEYASNITSLEHDFARVWFRLTSQDMGPVDRCTGPDVPKPQPWQDHLPEGSVPRPHHLKSVKASLKPALKDTKSKMLLANLAFQCASTYIRTSHVGGCNGARVRFSPQKDWPESKGVTEALEILEGVQKKHADDISWADLIVYAGGVALEALKGPKVSKGFCGGRSDARHGRTSVDLRPRDYYLDPLIAAQDTMDLRGLSAEEYVALFARPTHENPTVSNRIFKKLLSTRWRPVLEKGEVEAHPMKGRFQAEEGDGEVAVAEWALLRDPELLRHVRKFAEDSDALVDALGRAWTYLMNADRYDMHGSACKEKQHS